MSAKQAREVHQISLDLAYFAFSTGSQLSYGLDQNCIEVGISYGKLPIALVGLLDEPIWILRSHIPAHGVDQGLVVGNRPNPPAFNMYQSWQKPVGVGSRNVGWCCLCCYRLL